MVKRFVHFAKWKIFQTRVKKGLSLLKQYDPFGYSIYLKLKDKTSFDGYIQGADYFIKDVIPAIGTLGTAIHEILHGVDIENSGYNVNKYYLIEGTFIQVEAQKYLPQRKIVYKNLNEEDKKDWDLSSKADTYLQNFSGTMPFELLLEELNAYTIGANTVVNLAEGKGSPYETGVVNPGIIHMMRFMTLYLEELNSSKRGAYRKLKNNQQYTAVILKLWRQAELVINRVCSSKKARFNTPEMDLKTLKRTYSSNAMESLNLLFHKKETFHMPEKCN
ncbi:MAG: hypothetical protein ABUK01_13680 [Leptospirales bacterium]